MSARALVLDGSALTLADVAAFDEPAPFPVELHPRARAAMEAGVRSLRAIIAEERICYGVNTGFGAFANRRIAPGQLIELQYNLVRSHACGVGEALPAPTVRRALLLKANSLAAGHSGVRPELVDALLALLNHDVLPVVPSRGSVAASGDLAPLAHLALALIGEGEARHRGAELHGPAVNAAAGVAPCGLEAKEGLALLNGTQISLALALDGVYAADNLLRASILAGALSVESLAGSFTPFDERIHAVNRLGGQVQIAAQFRSLLTASEMNDHHRDCDRVQDPYSLRCMPQVLGAVWDTLRHVAAIAAAQLNAVTDNPLVFGDDVLSGGNFHGEPLAFACDFLAIAVAELAAMSERRTDLMERRVNPNLNMFLTDVPGLQSGYMIAHVAAAALTSENKTLAHPASVDSVPTSAGQEDHVSMAAWAGLKLARVCDNTALVLAIELLAAAHALDEQRPLATTPELERLHAALRAEVPFRRGDHRHDRDIEAAACLLRSGALNALLPRGAELELCAG